MSASDHLNRNQFEGSQNGYNQPVLDAGRYDPIEPGLRPTTPFPKPMRPPNVYRTRAGDNGILQGPNPNDRPRDSRPMDIDTFTSIVTGIPEGHYPVVDDSEATQKRMRQRPKTFPGPKMGMN